MIISGIKPGPLCDCYREAERRLYAGLAGSISAKIVIHLCWVHRACVASCETGAPGASQGHDIEGWAYMCTLNMRTCLLRWISHTNEPNDHPINVDMMAPLMMMLPPMPPAKKSEILRPIPSRKIRVQRFCEHARSTYAMRLHQQGRPHMPPVCS